MKKIIFSFLAVLLCTFFIAPAFANKDNNMDKNLMVEKLKNSTLVIYKNGKIEEFKEKGITPLLNYTDKKDLKGAYAFDRIIGRAAANLYAYFDCEFVYGDVISKPAIEILEKNNIKYEYGTLTDEIQNRDKTDLCPFEKLTKDCRTPYEAYAKIYKKIHPEKAIVYFSKEITPEILIKMYEITGKKLTGNVAVKLHSGEPGGNNFLKAEFVAPLVKYLNGTIVECNTAYQGRRNTTRKHKEVLAEHGFTSIAKTDIMDEEGEIMLPVEGGVQIKVNYVGSHLKNYDSMLVLSHFKGHQMAGFGGALKNLSIGIASANGKGYIHGGGNALNMWTCKQEKFLQSMADADKSVADYMKNNLVYINVMNNLSIDCDCNNHPTPPKMKDIGVLSSVDPVALDRACVDLVYNSNDSGKDTLIKRIEDKKGTLTIDYAEKLNVGTKDYKLVKVK